MILAVTFFALLAQVDFPVSFGTNLFLASAVIGFVLPVLIAAINRHGWTPEAKGACAFLVCALAALLMVYVQGQFNTGDWLRSLLIVFFVAIFTYNMFWKPSQIAPNIERATG